LSTATGVDADGAVTEAVVGGGTTGAGAAGEHDAAKEAKERTAGRARLRRDRGTGGSLALGRSKRGR
jgi:hypothetical protein